jgi:hypothetical protein
LWLTNVKKELTRIKISFSTKIGGKTSLILHFVFVWRSPLPMWVKEPLAHTNLETRKNKVWKLGAHKSLRTRKHKARELFVRFFFCAHESLSVRQQRWTCIIVLRCVRFLFLCKVFKNVKFSIKLVWPMLRRGEEKKTQFSFFWRWDFCLLKSSWMLTRC